MLGKSKSRWADDEDDAEWEAQRKREKEEKKKAKAEKQRKSAAVDNVPAQDLHTAASTQSVVVTGNPENEAPEPPSKRRRLTPLPDISEDDSSAGELLRFNAPQWSPSRHVDNFEKLNHIEEGSYGWVSRARETATGEVVALKKLKMDNPNDGFPVTGLREIQTLMASRHPHIVNLREVVVGDDLNE
jgi:cell division cycle 2-like protein